MKKLKTSMMFLLGFVLLTSSTSDVHTQQGDRIITSTKSGMRTTMMEPGGAPKPTDFIAIEVVEFTLDGRPISLDQPFRADVDWLGKLRARVKNISQKPISHVRIVFSLPEAQFQEDGRTNTMGFELEYAAAKASNGEQERKVVLPGEEVEALYMNSGVPLSQQIASRTGVTSIKELKYGGNVNAIFVDGGVWIGSNLPLSARTKPRN